MNRAENHQIVQKLKQFFHQDVYPKRPRSLTKFAKLIDIQYKKSSSPSTKRPPIPRNRSTEISEVKLKIKKVTTPQDMGKALKKVLSNNII